jgi:hypothetical protein
MVYTHRIPNLSIISHYSSFTPVTLQNAKNENIQLHTT